MEVHREKTHIYYQLQTKLYQIEDTLVSFSSLHLTLRQCFVLMLGGCASIQVWHLLEGSLGSRVLPLLVILIVAGVPSLLALLLALIRIADRYGEDWAVILIQYALCSRLALWQPFVLPVPSPEHSSVKKGVRRSERFHLNDQDEAEQYSHQERKQYEDNA